LKQQELVKRGRGVGVVANEVRTLAAKVDGKIIGVLEVVFD